MADTYDPIESTPMKKRRLNNGESKAYNSQEDSGDEFTEEDFNTVATLPLTNPKRNLAYDAQRMHHDLARSSQSSVPYQTAYVTQPTQALHEHSTQATQLLNQQRGSTPPDGHIQVERSSPMASNVTSPSRPSEFALPIKRALSAKPGRMMAPPGTAYRPPQGIQPKPVTVNIDSDDDPPADQSDNETQTQGLSSNIRPTQFHQGSRGDGPSSNDKRIQESPQNSSARNMPATFNQLVSSFYLSSSPDLAASSRAPRPQQQSRPGMARPSTSTVAEFKTLEDIPDFSLRRTVQRMMVVLHGHSVQQCHDALKLKRGHFDDAMEWLVAEQDSIEKNGPKDDLDNDFSPIKGVARSTHLSQNTSSQPIRPSAKQQVRAPARTIAEKYGARREPSKLVEVHEISDDEPDLKPRRRLQQGRKPRSESSPAPSSPLTSSVQQQQKPPVVIVDDDDSESGVGRGKSGPSGRVGAGDLQRYRNEKLLKFFNDSSEQDLVELCARPQEWIKYLIEQRPFHILDDVRSVSMPTTTKSGKKGKAKEVGEMLYNDCSEMFTGYDAVDELVLQCEQLAEPVQKALQQWGIADTDGELQVMKLDDAHDSGIGTPSSSCPSDDAPVPTASKKKKSNFIGQPENMNADLALKDYQLVGLNWLNLLFSKKLSCILADDMGLGKTCQVIAFLSYLKLQNVDGVHLVIVPGSTLENWLREFDRFSPDLVVRPYYGLQAERFQLQYDLEADFSEIDVIVTTYDMVIAKEDNKFFRRLGPFSVCVYDEAHALRNPESKRYAQLTKVEADFKVLLTGTPLQNNLQELIAILAFIMPGVFQEKREELEYIFKHKATTKDSSHAALLSNERIARARTMITPFILRRKKEQVLDLPKKTRRVEYCDMAKNQLKHYNDMLASAKSFYTDKANGSKAGVQASSNVIMSLRKAAIHPLLSRSLYDDKKLEKMVTRLTKNGELGGKEEHIRKYLLGEHPQNRKSGDYFLHGLCLTYPCIKNFALKHDEWMDAAKVQAFKELITSFIKNGDRTLVFSQFTTVMDILEAVLETIGVKFMRLDGTTNIDIRQDMIDKFTDDLGIPVFMLSTRAGGAGINLACANKVIIFDSGFNPQDDIQAENRAHRVGQTKEVEVVRLVTKGTIEEQIQALGLSKLAMGEGVAGDGGAADTDNKQADKLGEQMVERLLMEDGKKNAPEEVKEKGSSADLKDAFKMGLEGEGVKVASKQAKF